MPKKMLERFHRPLIPKYSRYDHSSLIVLLLCSLVLLLAASGCANSPAIPAVRQELPAPPVSLQTPPKGSNRLCELAQILNANWCSSPNEPRTTGLR